MTFGSEVVKWGGGAMERANDIKRASAFDLFSAIVLTTPVDKGTLRNNWFASIGAPSKEETKRAAPKGGATIGRIKKLVYSSNLGTPLYLTNNLPYVMRIEYEGYSSLAIGGMVRVNAQRWDKIVENNVRKFGGK